MENKKIKNYLGTNTVNPLLTDFYQFSMIFAHWKNGRVNDKAVFDLYFRKCPFEMNFCIFGGVDECLEYLSNFKFEDSHILYLKSLFPQAEAEFFDYLKNINMKEINVYGFKNADLVLPNEPLLTLEGPLGLIQLVETTLLNLTNYPSLIASLAFKIRNLNTLKNKILVEDGSICAQSPNGAKMGVKYSFIGGVEKTSNLSASFTFGIPSYFTFPNSEIQIDDDTFKLIGNENIFKLIKSELNSKDYERLINKIKSTLLPALQLKDSKYFTQEVVSEENLEDEILIFNVCVSVLKNISSEAFDCFLMLNFPDSLNLIERISEKIKYEENTSIFIRYNPIMLKADFSLNPELFHGVILGPEFIVSETQPALGMVYKLNQINGVPCIKFSEENGKQTIPGFKFIFRLYDEKKNPIGDMLCLQNEDFDFSAKEMRAYISNSLNSLLTIRFESVERMNNIIFSEGISRDGDSDVMNLQQKVKSHVHNNIEFKLFISEKIRDIIIEEQEKLKVFQ